MCIFRNNPYPHHGRSLVIPRGRGVLTVKNVEAMYEAKLEFFGKMGGAKELYNQKVIGLTFVGRTRISFSLSLPV